MTGIGLGRYTLKSSTMVWLVLLIVSFGGLIISTLQTSNFIYYFADFFNLLLLCCAIHKRNKVNNIQGTFALKILFFLFLLCALLGIVGGSVSIILAAWGIRNIFRYIVFFISCVILLDIEDIVKFQKIFPIIYVINAIFVLAQFFLFGLSGDYIGGIFGIAQGGNGALTIFLNVCLSYFICQFLNGRINFLKLAIYSILYLLVAALSETKGNYAFFVLIVAISVLISKKSLKTFAIVIVAIIALVLGLYLLNVYFPGSLDVLIDWDAANSYMDATYFGEVTFTRNNLIGVATEYFFKDNIWLNLFGYGTGACDTSSFFSSDFYQLYGDMNYRQYGVSMTLLQNGFIGLALYFLFFVFIFFVALRESIKTKDKEIKTIMCATCCIALFAMANSFYMTLYVDSAYWIYFALAIPFVVLKKKTVAQRSNLVTFNYTLRCIATNSVV